MVNRHFMKMLLFSTLLLSACASHQKTFHETASKEWVFPMGTYQHEISLKLKDGSLKNFNGVVQLRPDRIVVVGLSGFGTTVFKIQEVRATGKIETEIYVDAFKKFSDKLESFYKLIREMMLLKTIGEQTRGTRILSRADNGIPLKAEFMDGDKLVKVELGELDEHKIPNRMTLSQENFEVIVKVVGYDI